MRLEGKFTLLAPLSHIGESHSTDSYLNEEPVVQADGSVEPVFVYNGNAWRGQLRDLIAEHLCETMGITLPLPVFHLLTSGGSIGGNQVVDLAQSRALRRTLPSLSLLGGGVGTQLLPGKLTVGNGYPVCRETVRLVPEHRRPPVEHLAAYRTLTFAKSFTRRDDSKDPLKTEAALGGARSDEVQQMRYTVELMAAGAELYTYLELRATTDLEVGALAAGLARFAEHPFIGGKSATGHGRVALTYLDGDGLAGGARVFEADGSGGCYLCAMLADALEAYEAHLRQLDPTAVTSVVA